MVSEFRAHLVVTTILTTDECQNKYGNANAWRYCTRVFDLLTVAAVSVVGVTVVTCYIHCIYIRDVLRL